MRSTFLSLAVILSSSGCALLFAPKHRDVRVETDPPGAQILVDGIPAAVSPATVAVNHDNREISLRKAGYADASCGVTSRFHWGYLVADLFSLGLFVVVDGVTNSWTVPDPGYCATQLQPGHSSPRAELVRSRIVIKEKVQFEINRADIRSESFELLDDVARVMADHPQIVVEVQGHTDPTGGNKVNLQLSQDRADSVAHYLATKGVTTNRLHARGYGSTVPIADNSSDNGREMNRRVEFHVVR
jgi:outer membrane protein OmpA-like peptidoglycan-associated protein